MTITSHTTSGPLDFMNDTRDYERAAFGNNWVGPEKFEHGKEVLIAIYPCSEKSDGHRVDVYCIAYPARFYRLDVYDWPNSVGELQPGWEICTGSGAHKIAAHLAREIERGMLGFKPRNRTDQHEVAK